MDQIFEFLAAEWTSILFGGLSGFLVAWFSKRFFNKRGIFGYYVQHQKVGVSADDPVFGRVEVQWNGNQINHLYISTLTLKNESLNDYSDVVIQTFTSDTKLLTESTHILDTPSTLRWTSNYMRGLEVAKGAQPTDAQYETYHGQREYLIPVFNRGQEVKITYLNAANSDSVPHIWLSATVLGVRVRFRVPREEVYGVQRPLAILAGLILGAVLVAVAALMFDFSTVNLLLSMLFGVFVAIPGALLVKGYRKVRKLIGN